MARKSRVDSANLPAPKSPPPIKDQLWKVYIDGRLRRVYAIEVDEEGESRIDLLTWLGSV